MSQSVEEALIGEMNEADLKNVCKMLIDSVGIEEADLIELGIINPR